MEQFASPIPCIILSSERLIVTGRLDLGPNLYLEGGGRLVDTKAVNDIVGLARHLAGH